MTETPKILITGSSGFIGTNLLPHLHGLGYEVLGTDCVEPRDRRLTALHRTIDILDREALSAVVSEFQPNYMIHLAARTDLGESSDINGYRANTDGVQNVIDRARECPSLKRMIFCSSMLVCEFGHTPTSETDYCPSTLYGKSKVIGEELVRDASLSCEWLFIRPTSIWGPWFGAPYDSFFKFVLSGFFVHPGHKAGTATYGYVGNTVHQITSLLFASEEQVQGRVFYLGDRPPSNLSDWADEIAKVNGRFIPRIPYFILRAGALFGDLCQLLRIPFPLTSFRLGNMTTDNVLDLSPIYEVEPNPPFSREEGIKETLTWLQRDSDSSADTRIGAS